MMRPNESSKSLTLMFAAISLIFVYAACVFTEWQLFLYFVSSLFVMGVIMERSYILVVIFYATVVGISLLLVPDKMSLMPYFLFFGHYALGKYFIDGSGRKKGIILKLAYFNAAAACLYLISPDRFLGYAPEGFPFIAFAIMMEFVFIAYDWLFTQLSGWYINKLRANLKRSTY